MGLPRGKQAPRVDPMSIVILAVGGGVRIHSGSADMSGRPGVPYVAKCVACAALTLVVRQKNINLSLILTRVVAVAPGSQDLPSDKLLSFLGIALRGHVAHMKQCHPRTLQ